MPGPSLNPSHAFSLHNTFMRHKGFSFPFCRWANWHLEKISNYSKSWKLCNWCSTLSLIPNLVSNILNICCPFQVLVVHSNIKTIVSGYKCLSSHKELAVNFFLFFTLNLFVEIETSFWERNSVFAWFLPFPPYSPASSPQGLRVQSAESERTQNKRKCQPVRVKLHFLSASTKGEKRHLLWQARNASVSSHTLSLSPLPGFIWKCPH